MWVIVGGLVVGSAAAFTVYAHWKRWIFWQMGIPTAPHVPFLGCFNTYASMPDTIFGADHYHLTKYGLDGKFVGIFDARLPSLLIGDPDIIRTVLTKQSSDFYDRECYLDNDPSLLKLSVINLRGQHWKHVRQVLTPTFTPANLKKMLPIIVNCSNHLQNEILSKRYSGNTVDIREISGRFSLGAIASIAFGIDLYQGDVGDRFVKITSELFAWFNSITNIIACK